MFGPRRGQMFHEMKNAGRRAGPRRILLAAIWACLAPLIVRADSIPPCPSTVVANAAFPDNSYICSETDNLWLGFENLGTPLPEGTIFHIDTVTPGTVAITIEPGGSDQFTPGDTYSWEYEVIEDDPDNAPIVLAGSDYNAEFGNPTLTTVINEVDVTYPGGTPTPGTPGATLGTLDLTSGALQELSLGGPEEGLQFVNTLTIGDGEVIQAVSNEIGEAPEPLPSILLVSGLLLLGAFSRRHFAAGK